MRRLLALLTLFVAMLAGPAAFAHEVRPAYLEIDQQGAGYHIIWKQPTMGEVAIHLVPHMSNGWLEQPPADQYAADGFLVRTWNIKVPPSKPLAGAVVSIEGLNETITDVMVRVRQPGGDATTVVKPESPRMTIGGGANGATVSTGGFFWLGVEHILRGPDHLLFVLGLLLIVTNRGRLIKTVSAFTVAHSITLAIATLGGITFSAPLLNVLIALSILFIGIEVARARAGETSLTIRHPWAGAFVFGLLHGFGFASGLAGLGLDKGALALALVLFNLGVEAGQIAFIAVVLSLKRAFGLMQMEWTPRMAALPTYAVGVLGAYWTFQYGAAFFGI